MYSKKSIMEMRHYGFMGQHCWLLKGNGGGGIIPDKAVINCSLIKC